jgi:hypothetical protein
MRWKCCTAAALVAAAVGAAEETAAPKRIELPRDPKAVVISLDYRGGYTAPRRNKAPYLSILADGTVSRPDPFGLNKDQQSKITQAELQELLRYVVETQRFFQVDPKVLRKKLHAAEGGVSIVDASATVLKVSIRGKSLEVEQYALRFVARTHPQIDELKRLGAIEQRLGNLRAIVGAGGKKKAAEIVALANQHLKKRYPKAKPLTLGDLADAGERRDGTRFARLHRGATLGRGPYVIVSVELPPKGEPRVAVQAGAEEE